LLACLRSAMSISAGVIVSGWLSCSRRCQSPAGWPLPGRPVA
jgi:hypothetical protein